MVLRPVGDLPPSVYWVRRLLVLLVVVVVAGLLWWWWPPGDDGVDAPASAPTTSAPSPSPTETPTTSPKPKPTKTKTETEKAPECPDSAIEVTVEADAESYPPGRSPSFTFVVTNVSKETCARDVGQSANELRVTSGGVQIWSSDDCNPGGSSDPMTLEPEDRYVQTVSWPRVRSSEGCPTPQEEAEPGTYQVVARNLEILSEPAVFVLE